MQFVDGTDADKVLRAGTMTPARAVYIIGEVAKALDYADHRGVVHRDVKPANFLLSGPIGSEERVLLGDFGIARALGDAGLTVTGSVLATLSYASPEVLSGLPFDGRADQYSLGCTLFRLLTGKAPFAWVDGMAAVVAAHLQAPPPRVSDWAQGLSPRMDAVIATAMAKDPARRFSSSRELAAAATAALGDEAGSATAPWNRFRARRSARTCARRTPPALSGGSPSLHARWWPRLCRLLTRGSPRRPTSCGPRRRTGDDVDAGLRSRQRPSPQSPPRPSR